MNLGTELHYTLATSIGFMLQSIFFGIYCVIFAAFVRIRLKRTNKGSKVLLYLVTANFIGCTAYLGLIAAQSANVTLGMAMAPDALYICIDFISQVTLIYRCWIMWRQPWVMVVPILLTLAFLVISMTALAKIPSFASDIATPMPAWYLPTVLSFFSLSLAVNTLVTGLIISKILSVYRNIRRSESHGHADGPDMVLIISILMESGAITFVAQLVQTLIFRFANVAYPMVVGPVVMLYGISTAIVFVRVEMGLSCDDDNGSLKTDIRFERNKNITTTTQSFGHLDIEC